jgi:hypothetical protein
MSYQLLAALAFEPQLTALIVLAILAFVFFNRVPTLLKWMLVFFVVVCLFPGDRLAGTLGQIVASSLGPLLAFGMVIMGLRMIICGGRGPCRYCRNGYQNCRCRRGL